jgi:hypothetical protein
VRQGGYFERTLSAAVGWSYRCQVLTWEKVGFQILKNFSGDESLQTAQDIFLGQCLGTSAIHVVNGLWLIAQPAERNHVQGTVSLTITTSVQSHSMGVSERRPGWGPLRTDERTLLRFLVGQCSLPVSDELARARSVIFTAWAGSDKRVVSGRSFAH